MKVVSKAEKLAQRLRLRQARYDKEQRMLEKRSEEMEALEEVFDRPTLFIVYKLLNKGLLGKIHGSIKAGKESKLYWGVGPKGEDIAVKIFLTASAEFKKGRMPYIEGDPRFKEVKRDMRSIVHLWARKEFKNLEQAYASGVRVPKPIYVEGNVLLMEFIGDGGVPAPLMKETALPYPARTYGQLLEALRLLYGKARLVHGDLSEYNVMIWNGEPVVFDMAQAVPPEHPLALKLLKRDIANINAYFRRLGVRVRPEEEAFSWVVG